MPNCYCCSNQPFEHCCAPLLKNVKTAESPEALMRSRFSAFCTGNTQYLLQTAHANYLEAEDYQNENNKTLTALKDTIENTQWVGLKILKTTPQSVEFVAFFHDTHEAKTTPSDAPQQLHEHSQFVFENNRWLYLDGTIEAPIKIGRNDACYCGSQKKLKKCCIR